MSRQSQGLASNSPGGESGCKVSFASTPIPPIREILRQRKRRRLRKRLRVALNLVLCRLLPLLMLSVGIVLCFIGGFRQLNLMLSCGAVLLICSVGIVLQSCFWSRSQPNKFTLNEVLHSAPMDDADEEVEQQRPEQPTESPTASAPQNRFESIPTPAAGQQRASVGLQEFRRLSLAMTRVASELRNVANQNNHVVAIGPAGFARGLTLGGHPTNIAPTDYERGALNWYGNFAASEIHHMRRLSQWQNFV